MTSGITNPIPVTPVGGVVKKLLPVAIGGGVGAAIATFLGGQSQEQTASTTQQPQVTQTPTNLYDLLQTLSQKTTTTTETTYGGDTVYNIGRGTVETGSKTTTQTPTTTQTQTPTTTILTPTISILPVSSTTDQTATQKNDSSTLILIAAAAVAAIALLR